MLIETNKIKKNKIRVRLEPKSKVELVATTSAGASIKLENRFPLHHLLPVATPLHTVKKSSIKMIFFSPPHLEGSSVAAKANVCLRSAFPYFFDSPTVLVFVLVCVKMCVLFEL